jgi:hypothetical protein
MFPRFAVLLLILGVMAGTAPQCFAYTAREKGDCPRGYHRIAPYDDLHCEGDDAPHHHIHGHPPDGGECPNGILECECRDGERPAAKSCGTCTETGRRCIDD